MANQRKEHNVEKYIQWVTTLSLIILVYLHSFSCCNSSRSPNSLIYVPIERCAFLLVINSNYGRISSYTFSRY